MNQLWWAVPGEFEALFAIARRIREGDLSGVDAHRDALAALRARGTGLLAQAGRGASEATLRRIHTTLSALVAAGSFAPDAPGQLAADRDPPGFESAGTLHVIPPRPLAADPVRELANARRQRELEEARQRAEDEARERAAAERRRLEAQRARRQAERDRLEHDLRSLRGEIERRARELERMRSELRQAEGALEKSRFDARQLEARLTRLDAEE